MNLFVGLLLILYFLRLWLSGFGGIHPDEAYYWMWSLHPGWGYFDHPPMIAWIITFSQKILAFFISPERQSQDPLFWAQISLRLLPYFITCVLVPWILALCVTAVQKRPLKPIQGFVLLSSPLLFLGPQIVTPDVPFFLGWTLCLYLNIQFLRSRTGNVFTDTPTPASWKLSVLMGLALAFTAYSKHSAILVAFLVCICGLGLFNSMMVGAVALVLIIPHLMWNLNTGLEQEAGVFFQFAHRGVSAGLAGVSELVPSWKRVGELLTTQIAAWGPIVFFNTFFLPMVDIRRFFVRQQESRLTGSLFMWALVPLFFFLLFALHSVGGANWPLIGALGALVLTLSRVGHRPIVLGLTIITQIAINWLVIMVIYRGPTLANWIEDTQPHWAEQLRRPSRLHELSNWDRLHSMVWDVVRFDDSQDPIEVATYQAMSALLFYEHHLNPENKLNRKLYIFKEASRRSQYNIQHEYLRPETQTSSWLLITPGGAAPEGCTQISSLYKDIDRAPWTLCHIKRHIKR